MWEPLRLFLVEDEVLLLLQLETFLKEEGHVVVGTALSSGEAIEVARTIQADIALVDVHLADGPTGVEVGRFIVRQTGTAVVFMTANPTRISSDFSGAIGVIAKPYTQEGLRSALAYLEGAIRRPPPITELPRNLLLAPSYAHRWAASG